MMMTDSGGVDGSDEMDVDVVRWKGSQSTNAALQALIADADKPLDPRRAPHPTWHALPPSSRPASSSKPRLPTRHGHKPPATPSPAVPTPSFQRDTEDFLDLIRCVSARVDENARLKQEARARARAKQREAAKGKARAAGDTATASEPRMTLFSAIPATKSSSLPDMGTSDEHMCVDDSAVDESFAMHANDTFSMDTNDTFSLGANDTFSMDTDAPFSMDESLSMPTKNPFPIPADAVPRPRAPITRTQSAGPSAPYPPRTASSSASFSNPRASTPVPPQHPLPPRHNPPPQQHPPQTQHRPPPLGMRRTSLPPALAPVSVPSVPAPAPVPVTISNPQSHPAQPLPKPPRPRTNPPPRTIPRFKPPLLTQAVQQRVHPPASSQRPPPSSSQQRPPSSSSQPSQQHPPPSSSSQRASSSQQQPSSQQRPPPPSQRPPSSQQRQLDIQKALSGASVRQLEIERALREAAAGATRAEGTGDTGAGGAGDRDAHEDKGTLTLPTPESTPPVSSPQSQSSSHPHSHPHPYSKPKSKPLDPCSEPESNHAPTDAADSSFGDVSFDLDADALEEAMAQYD